VTNGAYEIDDIELWPQPDAHTWNPEQSQVLGFDGNGAPIKAKYRDCQLVVERNLDGQSNWYEFDDVALHDVTLPAPDSTDNWTTYSDCYVIVSHGKVDDAVAMKQITMTVRRAVA
jgi:hypothetical protein